MKKINYLLVGIVAVFFMQGCDGSGDHHDDAKKTALVIMNSSKSTARIVAAKANISGQAFPTKINVGNGIHRGKSMKYNISNLKCDKTWAISVHYNDGKDCPRWINVACERTTTVVFSNLDPDCG